MPGDLPIPPFAYSAHEGRGELVFAVCPSFADALAALAQHQRGAVFEGFLKAWRPDGTGQIVPVEAYKQPDPASREQALEFIRRREESILDAISKGQNPDWAKLIGAFRCHADDPLEKQVADYIKTSPWVFRLKPNEDWWL